MAAGFDFIFDKLTVDLFQSIIGNPMLIGITFMITLYVLGVVFKLSAEMLVIALYFGTMLIVSAFMPSLKLVLIIGLGIFIGIYLIYRILSR